MSNRPARAVSPESMVPCEVCEKEIPVSEAIVSEAEDYVLYFCGVECFERWRKKAELLYGNEKY